MADFKGFFENLAKYRADPHPAVPTENVESSTDFSIVLLF